MFLTSMQRLAPTLHECQQSQEGVRSLQIAGAPKGNLRARSIPSGPFNLNLGHVQYGTGCQQQLLIYSVSAPQAVTSLQELLQ